jgi:hypothetical protein
VVEGLKKRPPTHYVAKISNTAPDSAFLHTINRDTLERYKVIITDGNIQVFDLAGNEKTVTIDDDGYLDSADAKNGFRCVTISDYTIVANTDNTVKVQSIHTSDKNGSNFYRIQVANCTPNTTYHGYLDLPEGTVSNTGNFTWNGTPLEFDFTVTPSENTGPLVVAALKQALTDASNTNTRHIEEYVASWSVGDVWSLGVKRKNSTPAAEPALLDFRLKVNGTEAAIRESGYTATNAVTIPDGDVDIHAAHIGISSIIFVKAGNYGMAFTVSFPGYGISFTKTTSNTDVTDISTSKIATDLNTLLNADATFNSNFTSQLSGSLIKIISKPAPSAPSTGAPVDYAVASADGNGNRNLMALKDVTQKFSNLPEKCFDGFRIKIIGDAVTGTDDYYTQFDGNEASPTTVSEGSWLEVATTSPSCG